MMDDETKLQIGRKLAHEVYARAMKIVEPEELVEVLKTAAAFLGVATVVTDHFRHYGDVEEVAQDFATSVHDVVMFESTKSLRERGGELFLSHHAPALLTTPWEGRALLKDTVNHEYNKDGAEGVVRTLRRFGLPEWAKQVRLSAGL